MKTNTSQTTPSWRSKSLWDRRLETCSSKRKSQSGISNTLGGGVFTMLLLFTCCVVYMLLLFMCCHCLHVIVYMLCCLHVAMCIAYLCACINHVFLLPALILFSHLFSIPFLFTLPPLFLTPLPLPSLLSSSFPVPEHQCGNWMRRRTRASRQTSSLCGARCQTTGPVPQAHSVNSAQVRDHMHPLITVASLNLIGEWHVVKMYLNNLFENVFENVFFCVCPNILHFPPPLPCAAGFSHQPGGSLQDMHTRHSSISKEAGQRKSCSAVSLRENNSDSGRQKVKYEEGKPCSFRSKFVELLEEQSWVSRN